MDTIVDFKQQTWIIAYTTGIKAFLGCIIAPKETPYMTPAGFSVVHLNPYFVLTDDVMNIDAGGGQIAKMRDRMVMPAAYATDEHTIYVVPNAVVIINEMSEHDKEKYKTIIERTFEMRQAERVKESPLLAGVKPQAKGNPFA